MTFLLRFFAICQPTLYQQSRSDADPKVDVAMAFLAGFVVQANDKIFSLLTRSLFHENVKNL